MSESLPERLTLIFDGSCDFCTRTVRWLRLLDRGARIAAVPFQQPAAPESAGLTIGDCEQAVWAYAADGPRYRGAGAVNAALAVALGTPLPLWVYLLPGVRQLQDYVYALVARNRHHIPGDQPHCEQHPEDCR
ncbi:MAG TPA: DUF393 domain-containing protein [Herpetosiphonaceae bacterium]